MLQLSFVWWVSDLLLVHDYMLVKVGIRLEIQVVQLQIMEKQIFKSCTFTFSGLKIILWKKEKANHKSFVHGLFNWGDNFMEKQISLAGFMHLHNSYSGSI